MTIALLLVLLYIGGGLFLSGWVGRAIDNHPICRACGFDLVGRPAESMRCSECGADLAARRSMRIGHRRRRPLMLSIGVVLLLIDALVLIQIVASANHWDWNRYKPVWLLRSELKGSDPLSQSAALQELTRRVKAGELSPAQAIAIADWSLAHLGQAVWQPSAEFIEAANATKLLDRSRWTAYGRQSISVSLQARPVVRQGDPIPISVNTMAPRLVAARFVALFDWDDLRVDGVPAGKLPVRQWASYGTHDGKIEVGPNSWGSSYHPPQLDGKVSGGLAVGPHTVSVKLTLHVFDAADLPQSNQNLRLNPDESKELATIDAPLSAQFQVCDDANAPVLTVVDEQQRRAVEGAVKVTSVVAHRDGITVNGTVGPAPLRLDFQILVRSSNATGEVKTRDSVSGGPNSSWSFGAAAAMHVAAGERVDVIFRPSLQAAREGVDMAKIWGEEVVIRGVTVTPDPSTTTSPATRP
jgi:hypothetical protein